MDVSAGEGRVEQTRNTKYQKLVGIPAGSAVYSVGIQGQDDLVGKTVEVILRVREDQ